MTEKLNLKQKLVEIRKSVEYIQKTERGNQGAMYVDPAVILQKIRSGMDKFGVLLFPEVVETNVNVIDAPTSKNPQNKGYFSTSTLNYVWHDTDSDDVIKVPWFATGNHLQDPSMCFGGSMTYSERYFLLKFFQIPTSKDDPEYFAQKTGTIDFVSDEQIANIKALVDETGTIEQKMLEHFSQMFNMHIRAISEIPESKYRIILSALEAKR